MQVSYYLPSYLSEDQIFVPPQAATDSLVMAAYSEEDLAFEGRLKQTAISRTGQGPCTMHHP